MTEDERDTEVLKLVESLARDLPDRCHTAGLPPAHSCMAITLGYVAAMHALGMDREAMVFGVRNAPPPNPDLLGACITRGEEGRGRD